MNFNYVWFNTFSSHIVHEVLRYYKLSLLSLINEFRMNRSRTSGVLNGPRETFILQGLYLMSCVKRHVRKLIGPYENNKEKVEVNWFCFKFGGKSEIKSLNPFSQR